MRYICTYFDINFLPRGMALLESLEKNGGDFILYILALDNEVVEYFEKLGRDNIKIITLEEYISYFKIDRSKYKTQKEFYFSVTPGVCKYILNNHSDIDLLLYLDADVYLFNDIEILYDEIGDASIALCDHRIPWYIKIASRNYGIYNVGINAFRNNPEGNRCLDEWYKDCTTWVPNQEGYPLDFFSDQIWLDKWPQKYKDLKIIEHKGINTAPWNAIQYDFSKKDGSFYVDDKLLVIYHFSSLKKLDKNRWHANTIFTILDIKNTLEDIYKHYINNIEKYIIEENNSTIELNFTGSKIKMIIYNILKMIHNHEIKK